MPILVVGQLKVIDVDKEHGDWLTKLTTFFVKGIPHIKKCVAI